MQARESQKPSALGTMAIFITKQPSNVLLFTQVWITSREHPVLNTSSFKMADWLCKATLPNARTKT